MNYIFFDLDGTLLNTRDGIVTCVQKAIASQGIEIDDLCLLERHIGPPLKTGFMQYYGFDEETAQQVVVEYRKYYKDLGIPGTRPYEGMEECLKSLKEHGYHLVVATSKPEHLARIYLAHFRLDHYFDDICGCVEEGDQIRISKSQVIDYALKHNQISDHSQVTMVGDRFHDVEGAKAFGIPCVGVLFGFGGKEELVDAGAIATVSDCEELTSYFINRE